MPKQQTAKQPAKRTRHLYGAAIIGMLIIVLAGTWWYFNGPNLQLSSTFPANSAEQKDSIEEPKQPTNPNDITDAHNNIFKIPELGIQFVLPEGLEGLEYEMIDTSYTDESGVRVERFSPAFITEGVRGKGGLCGFGSVGTISVISKDMPDYNREYIKSTGGVYYIINGPQSSCSYAEGTAELQSEQFNLLVQAFKSMTSIHD